MSIKSLRKRNSPTCTLSQNGYGDVILYVNKLCFAKLQRKAGKIPSTNKAEKANQRTPRQHPSHTWQDNTNTREGNEKRKIQRKKTRPQPDKSGSTTQQVRSIKQQRGEEGQHGRNKTIIGSANIEALNVQAQPCCHRP